MRKLAFVVTLLAALVAVARADVVRQPEHVVIADADLIVVGRVLDVDRSEGRVAVSSVLKLKGRLETKDVVFSPTIEPQCVVSDDTPTFCAVDEWVVLMLKRDGDRWTAFGHESLTRERWKGTVEGVRELVPTLADAPERRRARMVRFLSSSNDYLRSVASSFVRFELQDKPELAAPHADALVAALDSPDPWVRMSAMYALQHVADARAVPKLIAATKVHGQYEDSAAWEALGTYDTDEVFSFLVAEAKREGGGWWPIRELAASKRPETDDLLRTIFAAAEGDRLREVCMAYARRRREGVASHDMERDLVGLLFAGGPRLEACDMGDALLAGATPGLVADVLPLLAEPSLTPVQERAVLKAAYMCVHDGTNKAVLDVLKKNEKLFTDLLDRGAGTSLHSTWIVRKIGTSSARACLERTAKSHPDMETRRQAASQLERRD